MQTIIARGFNCSFMDSCGMQLTVTNPEGRLLITDNTISQAK